MFILETKGAQLGIIDLLFRSGVSSYARRARARYIEAREGMFMTREAVKKEEIVEMKKV